MIYIQVLNKNGQQIDEARLFEEERHPLLPGAVGSCVKDLMTRNINEYQEIKVVIR